MSTASSWSRCARWPKPWGCKQPSLYAYFDSKNALYDAMFADGNRQLLGRLSKLDLPADPRAALKVFLRAFATFALEDPARNSLLFVRIIPGLRAQPRVVRAGRRGARPRSSR